MPPRDDRHALEAEQASREAMKGGLFGAIKWGAVMACLGGIGYALSPIYRGLTLQFKVYIQMSGMVLGGLVAADWTLREYEARMKMQRRIMRSRAERDELEGTYGRLDEEDEDDK